VAPPPIPEPKQRSGLRLALGRRWFVLKRRIDWYMARDRFARQRSAQSLAHVHARHATPMLRQLKGVDMWLQHNKVESLRVAASCIDGLLLRPGETFSFWRLVGKPTERRGFRVGMVLRNGRVEQGIGGGLCQMTNLIYWMAIHTDLTVTERWRHGFDVFPDSGRTQPFGSGATCAWNYIDLQIQNRTADTYQLRLSLEGDRLCGAWRCDAPLLHRYEIEEREHLMRHEWWGGYSRHNQIWRLRRDGTAGDIMGEEFLTENHAIMMYQPFLEAPAT
jgi:vancomycin resistance protein VanW